MDVGFHLVPENLSELKDRAYVTWPRIKPVEDRSEASKLYGSSEIRPQSIYTDLVDRFGQFVQERSSDQIQLKEISENVSELENELRKQADKLPQVEDDLSEKYPNNRDHNKTVLDRFRPEEIKTKLDEEWGEGSIPYEVYELGPDEVFRAHAELGTCRASVDGFFHHEWRNISPTSFEEEVRDPYTIHFGLKHEEQPGWVGLSRAYVFEDHENRRSNRKWLGVDTLELPYENPGGQMKYICDFANNGAVPVAFGLAASRYVLENQEFKGAFIGIDEGRAGGGAPYFYDSIEPFGPADAYKGASDQSVQIRKKGKTDVETHGHTEVSNSPYEESIDLIFEDIIH